jgi:hypothetical protein
VVNAAVSRIVDKFDLHLSYDSSRGRGIYNSVNGPVGDRTLPEEVSVATTLLTLTELPPTLSEFPRSTVDLVYRLDRRLSVGASYWYASTASPTSRSTSRMVARDRCRRAHVP